MTSDSMTWGNPVVDALEHFYGMPVEDLAGKLRAELREATSHGQGLMETAGALRCDEFAQTYLEQQHSRSLDRIGSQDLSEGHLRAAFVGRELVPVPKGGRPTVYLDGKHLGQDRLPSALTASRGEIKAALCYAHDVVLEDPFDEEQDLVGLVRQSRELGLSTDAAVVPEPSLFVANVEAVADLAPLARTGIVRFSPRGLAMNPQLSGRQASNAWDVDPSPDAPDHELVDRMMRIWLHSGGVVVPVFTDEHQERRFSEVLGVLAGLFKSAESLYMRRLGTLALPSADGLELRRMLDVRHESVFERFRSRQRSVLAAIDAAGAEDIQARQLFREEMQAAAEEVKVGTRSRGFARSLSPKLVGWGVGSLVGMMVDWRIAVGILTASTTSTLASFLSSSTAQALADATPRAQIALHHHYATLGKQPA